MVVLVCLALASVVRAFWPAASTTPLLRRREVTSVFSSRDQGSSNPRRELGDDDLEDVDLREYRAQLIAKAKAGTLFVTPIAADADCSEALKNRPTTTVEEVTEWAYETPVLEQGSVILGKCSDETNVGFAMMQQQFHKSVILLVQHDANFTLGLLLNRPSRRTVDGWEVWFGGDVCNEGLFDIGGSAEATEEDLRGRNVWVECLTTLPPDSTALRKVVKGVSRTSWVQAREMVQSGKATKDDFYVFVGYCGWAPKQLAGELERGTWYSVASDGGSLMAELAKTKRQETVLDNGDATWESVMGRIGRGEEAQRFAAKKSLEDQMLRLFVDERLDAQQGRETTKDRLSWQTQRASEALSKLVTGPPSGGKQDASSQTLGGGKKKTSVAQELFQLGTPPTNTETLVAPGALLAARAVGSDFLLNQQHLHKSLLLVVASSDEKVILVSLNRPTKRLVSIALNHKKNRQAQRSLAFGGVVPATAAPGNVLWIKMGAMPDLGGNFSTGDALPGPGSRRRRRFLTPHVCHPRDVGPAVASRAVDVNEFLAVCGVTVWSKKEFTRLLSTGALVPLEAASFPWDEVFDLHASSSSSESSSDNGVDLWHRAVAQSGLDPNDLTPRHPHLEAHLDDFTTTQLADKALQTFIQNFS